DITSGTCPCFFSGKSFLFVSPPYILVCASIITILTSTLLYFFVKYSYTLMFENFPLMVSFPFTPHCQSQNKTNRNQSGKKDKYQVFKSRHKKSTRLTRSRSRILGEYSLSKQGAFY